MVVKKSIIIILIVTVIGCQGTKQNSTPIIKREQNSPQDFIKILDKNLEEKIVVVSVFKYTDLGLLGFQLNIRQEKDAPFWIEYQTVFYSENGEETERTYWKPQLLIPKEDIGLPGRATFPTSKKFIVYIRNYTGEPTPVK